MLSEPELLSFIHSYIQPRKNNLDALPDPNDLLKQCQQILSANGNLQEIMMVLERHRDIRAGIRSVHCDNQVWMRDTRRVDRDVQTTDPWENFAIQGINYLAAIELMFQQHHFDANNAANIETINQAAKIYLTEFSNPVNQEKAKECAAKLLVQAKVMAQTFFNVNATLAEKYIEIGKEFVNMKYVPYTVVTLSQKRNSPMTIEVDIPVAIFRGELEQYYQDYKKLPWFLALPDWQQSLVRFSLVRLQAGAMIPTQLRRYLAGPRNFYQRWLLKFSPDNQLQFLLRCFHSGTPAHLFEEDAHSLSATQMTETAMYESIQAYHLHLNGLLSPLKARPEEYKAHMQIVDTVRNRFIYHANTPVNGLRSTFRLFLNNEVEQMCTAIEALGESRVRPGLGNWFSIMKALFQYYVANTKMADDENPNLRIQSVFAYIFTMLADPLDHAVNFYCMSGKDRTNILLIFAAAMTKTLDELFCELSVKINNDEIAFEKRKNSALNRIVENDEFEAALKVNEMLFAFTGHCRLLAGAIGATHGCAGIKKESFGAAPASIAKGWAPLFGASGAFNTKGPTVPLMSRVRTSEDPYDGVVIISAKK